MKFILISSYYDSIPKFRGDLIRELVFNGFDVFAMAPLSGVKGLSVSLDSLRGVEFLDVALDRNGVNPCLDFISFLDIYRKVFSVRPQVVLGYTAKPVIYGLLAAWLVGVPRRYALITGLGYGFTGGRKRPLRAILLFLYKFSLVRAHKVFFQNPDDEKYFRQMGVLPSYIPSVVVNGSGVDIGSYSPMPLPVKSSIFLLIGRLLGDKGVREFAEAARRVKACIPSTRFLLAGWIDTNPDAIGQDELDAWIADGIIEFLGKLDDVRPTIADASVYVLPSYREGTPRTVLEAMAMGRPIITTDAPGCRETVIDGENGFLVPVKSVDALVEAMLKFIEDPTLAPRMGRRSREIAEEKYDVHKVNAVMLREMGITPVAGEGSHA
jgi:glycosyltransferase involved in cell wall biosynthesis